MGFYAEVRNHVTLPVIWGIYATILERAGPKGPPWQCSSFKPNGYAFGGDVVVMGNLCKPLQEEEEQEEEEHWQNGR